MIPSMGEIDKAVVLAAGLGTRMRRAGAETDLSPQQREAADRGHKALMPVAADRPFLDYALTALADAGYTRVCLVVGPDHDAVRLRYQHLCRPRRLALEFAVQAHPLGTADAVRSAETFAAGDQFLVVNSDNLYPVEALMALRRLNGPGLAAFERQALVEQGNIPPERIARFAVLQIDPDGCLRQIVEKPDPHTLDATEEIYISMNCWRFDPSFFESCRSIQPSSRGEFEIASAVEHSIRCLARRYQALRFRLGVLDLSSRQDVPAVAHRLTRLEVDL